MSVEYFVNVEPIHGELICYGPFSVLGARACFEHMYPAFDGGSVTLTKIESNIHGISPSELRRNALEEEYDYTQDPESEMSWGEMLRKGTTLLARDVWDTSSDQAGVIYKHAGKQYEPAFLAEISHNSFREDHRKLTMKEPKSFEHRDLITWLPESLWTPAFYSEPASIADVRQLAKGELLDSEDLTFEERAELRQFLQDLNEQDRQGCSAGLLKQEEDKMSKEKQFYDLEPDGANDSHYLCETSGGKRVRIARFNDLAKAEAVRERFMRMEAERSENVEEQEQGMQL